MHLKKKKKKQAAADCYCFLALAALKSHKGRAVSPHKSSDGQKKRRDGDN